MRILQIIQRYSPAYGGAEKHVQEISERLVKRGHDVTVWTSNAFDIEAFWLPERKRVKAGEEVINGVKVKRFPIRYIPFIHRYLFKPGLVNRLSPYLPTHKLRSLYSIVQLPEMWEEVGRAEKFDIVHVTAFNYFSNFYTGEQVADKQRIPFFITPLIHPGSQGELERYYLNRTGLEYCKRADQVVAITEIERELIISKGIDAKKVRVWGHGIDPDKLGGGHGDLFRKRHKIPKDGKIILQIGAQVFDKGFDHTFKAIQKLWDKGMEIYFVFIGRSLKRFEEFAKEDSRVAKYCVDLGFVSEEEKKNVLAACDVYCMPSRTDSFGIVFLESWFYEKPVIGARAGGVREVIDDGENGFLVGFGSIGEIVAKLEYLFKNLERAKELGRRGKEKTLTKWEWGRIIDGIEKDYEKAIVHN